MPASPRKKSRQTRSKKFSSKNKCSEHPPITKKKVCGPRKSCAYPHVYTRQQLVQYIKRHRDEIDIQDWELEDYSKEELCSVLDLSLPEIIDKYRMIDRKVCGPQKNAIALNVWTLKELKNMATELGMSKSVVNKMSKGDLCVEIAEIKREQRLKELESKQIKLIPVKNITRQTDYVGYDEYLLTIIYNLLLKHSQVGFYINPYIPRFFGITWDCAENVDIADDLLEQIERCKFRFFIILIRLETENDDDAHVNFFLVDKEHKKISSYDPLGSWDICPKDFLEEYMKDFFQGTIGYKLLTEQETCPTETGVQSLEINNENLIPVKNNEGLCAAWSLWMLDMKLSYPKWSIEKLHRISTKLLKQEEYGISVYIASYITDMLKGMKEMIRLAKIDKIDYTDYLVERIYDLLLER